MIVRYSPEANADLSGIGRWIARDNPARAVSFVLQLRAACEELSDSALLYPLAPGSHDLHQRLVRPYLILYRIRRSDVYIVSVRHGRRDSPALR